MESDAPLLLNNQDDAGADSHCSTSADDIDSPPSTKNVKMTSLREAATANDNKYVFYCIPCLKNVSCAHMGIVRQHTKSIMHFLIKAPKFVHM